MTFEESPTVELKRIFSIQPLSYDEIRRLLREVNGDDFETERSLEQNLTFRQAEEVFAKHEVSFGDEQRRSLGVVGSDGLFTNLGLMLSDQCPFSIKIARFKGSHKTVFQTRREVGGSLLAQVSAALEMLDMLNEVHAVVEGNPERREWRDYPPEALREVVLNAVVHRDYEIRASIGINVYDDRCEVVSPGGLPRGATFAGALAGVSVARNAGLAAIFYRLRWIEAYGTGLAKIRESYEGKAFEPAIDFLDGAVKVVLPSLSEDVYCGEGGRLRRFAFSADSDPGLVFSSSGGLRAADFAGNSRMLRMVDDPADPAECPRQAALLEEEEKVLAAFPAEGCVSKSQMAVLVGFNPRKTAALLKNLVQKGKVEALGATRSRTYRLPR